MLHEERKLRMISEVLRVLRLSMLLLFSSEDGGSMFPRKADIYL
jgi:hypothetical protein